MLVKCCYSARILFPEEEFLLFHFSATLLNSESARMVVGVSGKVQSETPIKCEFGDLRGVVVKQRVQKS